MATLFEQVFNDQFVPLDRRKLVGNYKVDKMIGQGSFSTVREGVNTQTGQKAAVKIISKKSLKNKEHARKMINTEIKVLRKLSHKNIVRILDWMETETNVYLVLDLVEGINMKEYLRQKRKLRDNEARDYFGQIVDAVAYMHNLEQLHRDLKPSNFVLQRDGQVIIVDFGLSVNIQETEQLTDKCGSPVFIAPEILSGAKFSSAADVWSLGVSLYLFVTGDIPFSSPKQKRVTHLHFNIMCGYKTPAGVSLECSDLITKMLILDNEERITLNEVLSHPWLKSTD